MTDSLLEALNAIDPSKLNYAEWIEVGMALKAEGHPSSVWDDWSRRDPARYHDGDCDKKWETFEGSGTNGGTIIHFAKVYGNYTPNRDLDWDDGLDAYYYEETLVAQAKPEEKPYQMAARYLETLFAPDEKVSFVHSAVQNKDGKWVPADGGNVRLVSDIIKDLRKHRKMDAGFGTINENAGAWIRPNPTTGPSDKNVTRYAYCLVESDQLTIEEQQKMLINFKLPIAALVESGGKSVHAIVKVDAKDLTEYKQRVSFLYDWLAKHSFIVDEANKNPARLSRLPGAMRDGKLQKLLATDIGCSSWLDWLDHVRGVDDDLPAMKSLWEQAQDPPELSPELISGVLREGCKMIITGESKAGKTCLSQNLAVCIAEGKPWLGKFQCQQGKVLYINLEVEEASLYRRFESMYQAMKLKMTKEGASNIIPWNLRGYAVPLDKLAEKIIRRCRNTGPYKAIILDPLYKVQQGDENSAEAIIKFCNALDQIAHETGAAVLYDHHHPKGVARDKVIDRGAGSGVFARDADAICDLSFLEPGEDILSTIGQQIEDGEKPMQISFVLRDFKDIKPINIWFRFPLHFVDTSNLLEGAPVEGSRDANLAKSPKRTSEKERLEKLRMGFFACEEDGKAKLSEMVDYFGGSPTEKSLRRYVKESKEFEIDNGYVKKRSEN